MVLATQSPTDESLFFEKLASRFADLIVFDSLVAAIAVGLVAALFALAQVIILAFAALERQRSKLAAAV
jgi:hypothetical protein